MPKSSSTVLVANRRARREFLVTETLNAGMALKGTEVKSARAGRVSLTDAYCRVRGTEVVLVGAHFAPYSHGNINNHDPLRERRLLLHRREIKHLKRQVEQKGFTVIPLKMYLSGGLVKLQIGLARGKRQHDKRQDLARREVKRRLDQTLKQYRSIQ